MASLFITELSSIVPALGPGNIAIPAMPANAEQSVAIGASSAASAPFAAGTRYVELFADATCAIAFGVDNADNAPTAVATLHGMAANERRIYAVAPGGVVAVITRT
jgi:hypothetical protein